MYNLLKIGNTLSNKILKEDYMRRNARKKRDESKDLSDKIIMYSVIGVIILTVIVLGLLIYSKSLSDDVKNGTMSLEKMAEIAKAQEDENQKNENQETASASTDLGKTVEESKKEETLNVVLSGEKSNEEIVLDATKNKNMSNSKAKNNASSGSKKAGNKEAGNNSKSSGNAAKSEKDENDKKEEIKRELNFIKPVEGEVVKQYAKDNLVYSETLKEWTTHMGIDIKADKTTVVKAAEEGVVKSIKNDPRYGLTIVIDHGDDMQTVYANLLTSEFVVEGETVKKGQSLGTVGNTAVFEIADDAHLHFEILKNSIPEDPSIYIK